MRAPNLRAWVIGAAGQLGAADAGREAEVVLDPARGARLAAEHGALDHQRVEPLRGAVDRGAEAGRPAADDEQVDLLARPSSSPIPSARESSPLLGRRSSAPPGSRTSGSSSGVERARPARPPRRSRSASSQV